MKRILTVIGTAAIVAIGAVAASQAQGRPNPPGADGQRGNRPGIGQGIDTGMDRFECGPPLRPGAQGQGVQPGRGQRGPQGAMRGRGAGAGRQGAPGRPGGPGGPGRMGGRGSGLCGLDLTADQKAQIAAVREHTRQEIEALLTPEQRAKLRGRRGGAGAGGSR